MSLESFAAISISMPYSNKSGKKMQYSSLGKTLFHNQIFLDKDGYCLYEGKLLEIGETLNRHCYNVECMQDYSLNFFS